MACKVHAGYVKLTRYFGEPFVDSVIPSMTNTLLSRKNRPNGIDVSSWNEAKQRACLKDFELYSQRKALESEDWRLASNIIYEYF